MAGVKWCKLRSGVLFAYTRTAPPGSSPVDETVDDPDGVMKMEAAALIDEQAAQALQVGDLPAGPVLAIIEWVGDDPQRAHQAIEAESQRAKPRASVITAVSHLVEPTSGE